MTKKKLVRTRGKLQLSRYFQKLEEGDSVSVVKEPSMKSNFPKRFQGRVGVIEGKRGRVYIIKIKDQSKQKKLLIEPIHLNKMEYIKKNDKKQ